LDPDIQEIIRRLEEEHSGARLQLAHGNPLELLIGAILSAQSTDSMANRITVRLLERYTRVEDLAAASLPELEEEIRSSGYFRVKARYIKSSCEKIVEEFGAKVPSTMEELLSLPGVGRKTANIVLTYSFGIVEGIAVDTHVFRVSRRLGLSTSGNPEGVERDLMGITPRDQWMLLGDLLIFHGRRICDARKPECGSCVVSDLCPSAFSI